MTNSTMTQQQYTGEHARRLLGRILGAADDAGLRAHVRFDITVYRAGRVHTQVDRQAPAQAIRLVGDAQREADANGESLAYTIHPIWPSMSVSDQGFEVGEIAPARLVRSAVFDPDRTEAKVRDLLGAAGIRKVRIRNDETDGGRVQSWVTVDGAGSMSNLWLRAHEALEALPGGMDYFAPLANGVKVIWAGVR